MLLPGQPVSLCDARDGYPTVHRCDDPVTCAILSLSDETEEEPDDDGTDPDELADRIVEVRELATDKRFARSKLAKEILEVIGR